MERPEGTRREEAPTRAEMVIPTLPPISSIPPDMIEELLSLEARHSTILAAQDSATLHGDESGDGESQDKAGGDETEKRATAWRSWGLMSTSGVDGGGVHVGHGADDRRRRLCCASCDCAAGATTVEFRTGGASST